MKKNKSGRRKRQGRDQAGVEDALMDNGGAGAGVWNAVRKGARSTGKELLGNASGTSEPPLTEEQQMEKAIEESKRMYEATLKKTANIDIREDKDYDGADDYWNKKQSNLPQAEAEKQGGSVKPADTNDNSWGKRTTAGRIGDCPPGRSVMGRNNGNVENKVREIGEAANVDSSGVLRDKRSVDNVARTGRPARTRGSGPNRQYHRQQSGGREFAGRQQQQQQQQLVRETDAEEKLTSLKNEDKPEVVETCQKQPAEEKLRLEGFNSRLNRPSPEDRDPSPESTSRPEIPGVFSEKLETRPRCGSNIYNAPPGFPQPQSFNNHNKPPPICGRLASNPDSEHAYDQLAIHDPLLYRLLVQKHIHDQSSSTNPSQVSLLDFENHRHHRLQQQQQQQQREEEEYQDQDEEAMLEQQQSNVYGQSGCPGPSWVMVRLPYNGQPSQIFNPMEMMSLNLNTVYDQAQQHPPVVDPGIAMTPRGGTAPSHQTLQMQMVQPQLPMPYQSPLGPRYFQNPYENLVAPESSLLPNQYEQTSLNQVSVPPAGRQQQYRPQHRQQHHHHLPFSSRFHQNFSNHQYRDFPRHNSADWANFPAPPARDSRQPQPNVERFPR